MSNAATKQAPEPTETEQVLQAMFTENTGRALCDSGGAYGRNWQRNQGVNFLETPEVTVDRFGFHPRVSAFHMLNDLVTYDPEMQARFEAYVAEHDHPSNLVDMEAFVEDEIEDATGLYGDGAPATVNTYNQDCCLSQTLQFHFFSVDDEAYILLQVHGGCDVRGGYTKPKAFKVEEDHASLFCRISDCGAYCPHCETSWYSDDAGHNFYPNDEGEEFKGHDVKQVDGKKGEYLCPHCGEAGLEPTR